MKLVSTVISVLLTAFLVGAGCDRSQAPPEAGPVTEEGMAKLSAYARYAPVKVDILPLTEVIFVHDIDRSGIDVYVSLIDQYGCQVKSPGRFRFELYEHVQRSAEPKGRRITIWPDFDLDDPAVNNEGWLDFLRAYEFNLPFDQAGAQDYILEVTCFCPNGRRLLSQYILRHTE